MGELNYKHLRYFWAVAHDGNLTRTAERLNLSQSALSVQIRRLEERLGHPLFERRGRQLHLTEAGRIALDHADAIFAAGEEMVNTLKGRAPARRQVLRVGAIATLSRNFQIAFFKPLLGRSDVELIVRSGALRELLDHLESHRLDVVLANLAPPRDATTAWVSHLIAEQPVSLVGRKDRLTGPIDLNSALADYPLVLPSLDSSIRVGFDALMDREGIRPIIAAEVDDMAMLRLLAREGIGLAVVPPIVVRDELELGVLCEIARIGSLSETFFAVTLSRRFPNRLLRMLLGSNAV
ncbi:MAG: LysR family transcriptional regulator [Rhodospirillales bacterium]|jgi:LysR family transcriptional activator of nhaA|nr:LysR family transcriptional regulator [Rhodospirillales bacterium]